MRHWYRYFAFLKIAAARFDQAATRYASQRSADAGIKAHLEVDTFYLFASILLDRVAMVFSYYFWRKPNWEHWQMHLRFSTAFSSWADDCSGVQTLADELQDAIADYRNFLVVHVKDPRLDFTILSGVSATDALRVAPLLFEPRADDFVKLHKRSLSGDLPVLVQKLRQYLAAVISFMEAHAENSKIVRRSL